MKFSSIKVNGEIENDFLSEIFSFSGNDNPVCLPQSEGPDQCSQPEDLVSWFYDLLGSM